MIIGLLLIVVYTNAKLQVYLSRLLFELNVKWQLRSNRL